MVDIAEDFTGAAVPPADNHQAKLSAVRDSLPRLDLAALLSADRPPRAWLWWRLIPEKAAVALVAPAGVGKSLLLLALAVAITIGHRAFAGLRISNRRVLLIDMENTEDDLAERFQSLGVTADDAAKLDGLVYQHLPMLPPLDTPAGGQALLALVDGYDIRAGDVVILDSIQRLTIGKEQRQRHDSRLLPAHRTEAQTSRPHSDPHRQHRQGRGSRGTWKQRQT
jgi:hypothetical protein